MQWRNFAAPFDAVVTDAHSLMCEEFHLLRYNSVRSVESQLTFHRNVSLLVTYVTLVSCLAYSSTLKMEATCSTETFVDFQQTTQRYIPKSKSKLLYDWRFTAISSSWRQDP
jgi:hypothetical protein